MLLRAHDGFLALIAPGVTFRGELSPELPATTRRAVLVWEVEQAGGGLRGVLHVELQTKITSDIGERMAAYAIRLWQRGHLPVRSVVVFLRPARTVPEPPFVIEWMGRKCLRYDYDAIRLWEIPRERILDTTYYELWPLASLAEGVTPESTLAVAERIAAAPLPQPERSELIGLLVVLAGLRLRQQRVLDVIRGNHMLNDLLSESSVAKYLEQLGMEKGMEKGLQLGAESGLRESVVLVLEGRFGALDEALRAAIAEASEAALREALRHAATDAPGQILLRLRSAPECFSQHVDLPSGTRQFTSGFAPYSACTAPCRQHTTFLFRRCFRSLACPHSSRSA